jgi:sRNA-binding regulator protein Hfq
MSEDKQSETPTAHDVESAKPRMPQFLPKLRGQQVLIRLNDGRPMTGKLVAFNAYELILDSGQKTFLIFKHSVASIEVPKGVLD